MTKNLTWSWKLAHNWMDLMGHWAQWVEELLWTSSWDMKDADSCLHLPGVGKWWRVLEIQVQEWKSSANGWQVEWCQKVKRSMMNNAEAICTDLEWGKGRGMDLRTNIENQAQSCANHLGVWAIKLTVKEGNEGHSSKLCLPGMGGWCPGVAWTHQKLEGCWGKVKSWKLKVEIWKFLHEKCCAKNGGAQMAGCLMVWQNMEGELAMGHEGGGKVK